MNWFKKITGVSVTRIPSEKKLSDRIHFKNGTGICLRLCMSDEDGDVGIEVDLCGCAGNDHIRQAIEKKRKEESGGGNV